MDANTSGKTDSSGRTHTQGKTKTKREWLAFRGADYLATKIVLGVTAVGAVMYGLGVPVIDAARNAPLA